MKSAVKIIVSGRVQNVFFRISAKKQADKDGIVGYAKNLAKGGVEIKAIGDKIAVGRLIVWTHKGSPFSVVKKVVVTDLEAVENFSEFTIK